MTYLFCILVQDKKFIGHGQLLQVELAQEEREELLKIVKDNKHVEEMVRRYVKHQEQEEKKIESQQ